MRVTHPEAGPAQGGSGAQGACDPLGAGPEVLRLALRAWGRGLPHRGAERGEGTPTRPHSAKLSSPLPLLGAGTSLSTGHFTRRGLCRGGRAAVNVTAFWRQNFKKGGSKHRKEGEGLCTENSRSRGPCRGQCRPCCYLKETRGPGHSVEKKSRTTGGLTCRLPHSFIRHVVLDRVLSAQDAKPRNGLRALVITRAFQGTWGWAWLAANRPLKVPQEEAASASPVRKSPEGLA